MNWGIEVLQTSALPLGYGTIYIVYFEVCLNMTYDKGYKLSRSRSTCLISGAGYEVRTRYLHLGKVALYQMSYIRKWCLRSESNQRHVDFQSTALPTELQRQGMATRNGLEPSTSSVTGWRANRLHHRAIFCSEQLRL